MRRILPAVLMMATLSAATAAPTEAPASAASSASGQVAAAPSRLDAILARGTLRVGLTGDYRPFGFRPDASTPFEGFDVDMANALGQALGVKVEFVPTSWPILAKDFEADAFDMAAGGVSITLDRQKKGLFSTPIMREGKTPIARCGDVAKYQSVADIDQPQTRVIVNPGGTNERFARANIKLAPIEVFRDNVTIFDQIASGQAIRLRRKGLLAATRRRPPGLRRPVAAHHDRNRQVQDDLRQVVQLKGRG